MGNLFTGTIDVYGPGMTKPKRMLHVFGDGPYYFALNKAGTLMYVPANGATQVSVYNYRTGNLVDAINSGLLSAQGVAIFPPEIGAPF